MTPQGRLHANASEGEMMMTIREEPFAREEVNARRASRMAAVVLALAILAGVAPAARAADFGGNSLTIEGFAGYQNLNIHNAATSIANATQGNEGTAIIGGDVLAKLSLFGVGLTLDKTVSGNGGPWAGALLAGVVFDV